MSKRKRFGLDERFANSKFDYCKNLKWFLIAPVAIIIIGVVLLCSVGFNLGIDFTGGSNMTIYIDEDGTYGDVHKLNDTKEIENIIQAVLDEKGLEITTIQTTTMNVTELGIEIGNAVIVKYQNDNSLKSSEIEEVNDQIKTKLLQVFGFDKDTDEKYLIANGGITTASASAELMMKSFIALLVALVLMLVYIIIRFELTSGLAAVLALFHDVLVTGSIVLLFRVQINVSFIAALITILGYSINNTIIIFDRMRSDLRVARNANERIDNNKIANNAVKGTMMRSILTGVTTLVMVLMITIIGVADIREFAFPILVGIVAGFYSSVFITPGLWAIAYRPKKRAKVQQTQSKKQEVVEEVETEE